VGWRVGILGALLLLRLGVNCALVAAYKQGGWVRVTGKVFNTYQSMTECTIKVGKLGAKFPGWCPVGKGDKIIFLGKVSGSLIDRGLGRVWLDEAQIILIEPVEIRGREWLVEKRERLVGVYQKLLPEPEAALVAGIVLGQKGSLPDDFYQSLVNSGTIHIVVASGYNVMIVGAMVLALLLYLLKRRVATGGAIMGMLVYALLAGAEAPVLRATLMGGLIFIGLAIGRREVSWWSLLLAGWLMVMIEPVLLESISFQLTVAASTGLLVVAPRFTDWIEKREWGWVKLLLKTELVPTISAQMLTMPFIWWHFGRVNWWGVLTNLVVLPLVPMVMLLGGVTLILGLIWLPLGQITAWLTYSLAHLVVLIVKVF